MKRLLPLCLLLAAGAAAQDFYGDDAEGDVLTATDSRGNIATVYNLFDGQSHAIQVTRLDPRGGIVWNIQHNNGIRQKAFAAAMDAQSALYVSGVRRLYRHKYLLTMKFDANGYLAWENADGVHDCTSMGVVVDREGDVLTAGMCRYGSHAFPARIVKYGADGAFYWAQEYDGGGRNYVRDLQVDFENNLRLTIETVYGNYRDGSFQTRTVVFNPNGALIEVR